MPILTEDKLREIWERRCDEHGLGDVSALFGHIEAQQAEIERAKAIIDELVFALVNADPESPHQFELVAERNGLDFLSGAGKLTGGVGSKRGE